MILENVAQLRHITQTIAARGRPRSDYYTGDGLIPSEIIHKAAEKTPLGDCTWVYYGMSYGPEHIRKYKLEIIDKEFNKVEGCRRIDPATLPEDEYFWARDRVATGSEWLCLFIPGLGQAVRQEATSSSLTDFPSRRQILTHPIPPQYQTSKNSPG